MSPSQYACPETLVDTQWLSEHLQDPKIQIIEMDMNSEVYERGHIPGSIFWNAMITFTKSEEAPSFQGGVSLTPDLKFDFNPKAIAELLGNSGITNDTTIVAVHHDYIATSGCLFWLLKVFGHNKIKILNGGLKKWAIDGYPLTKEESIINPTQYYPQPVNQDLRITLSQLQTSLSNQECTLLDVRTPEEYRGEIFMMNPPTENERGGHIPGATNLYYELAHNEDDTFKSFAELQEIFANKNITPDKLIIPYCAVGGRSAHTWFILKYLLGYPQVKNYDGSWNQWSRLKE